MRPIPKLTPYFFQAASQQALLSDPNILLLQATLLDLQKCPLCAGKYSISDSQKIPRIIIHCGHTFCSECLSKFHLRNKLRCPSCLKLVKSLPEITDLPINHTIYSRISLKQNNEDPLKFLCSNFTIESGKRLRNQKEPTIDDQTGLSHCCFHQERIQHLYCVYHDVPGCRQCVQTAHSGKMCKILDLYDLKNQK